MHSHSRRSFLRQVLGASWVGASILEQAVWRAAQARAQSKTAPATLFDLEKVAEGVYAALARPVAQVNCNAAIFENSGDVLIVDSHSKSSAVAALVAQIRKEITAKPIRYVVNTHFHWDHTQGNPAYKKLAPQADFISSTVTRDLIAKLGGPRLKDSLEQAGKALETFQQKLGAAKTGKEKSYYQRMISETRAYLAEMRNYAPELPNITFCQHLSIHDRSHELHLAFRGRGHTGGDIVVYCEEKKVIATGDLLHGFLPYLGDGYPLEWPRTLRSVADFDFQQAIGGHGGVQHTRDRLDQMAGYIQELAEAVVQGKKAGRTVAQLQAAITPATLKTLEAGGYGRFVSENLVKYYGDFEMDTPAEALAKAVQENVAGTFTALERT